MNEKSEIIIEGQQYVTIRTYLSLPECCWAHKKTVEHKIHFENFPAIKRAGVWWVSVKGAELWHKRRDSKIA